MESGSSSMMSGGELTVENVSAVGNKGVPQNVNLNAKISTFNSSLINTFLKYPTILFDGTINTSTVVGTTIYATSVSPSQLKSTSVSRIANFATNFRQWNGCMKVRMIFTKPVFVQTKVIVAFIPGIFENDADSVSIPDMYGAQFHAVMNPDNEAELSFDIPFISGKMWHEMTEPTGLFLVKLFQPLIASQPTGTSAVSIPFTITISSSYGELQPLDFRFLVAPSFQNPITRKDAKLSILNSISPTVANSANQTLAGIIPISQTLSLKMKTLVFLPVSKYNDYLSKYTLQTPACFVNQQSVSSLNLTKDFVPAATLATYNFPCSGMNYYNNTFTPLLVPTLYTNINANALTDDNTYCIDGLNSGGVFVRLLYVSNVQVCPPGSYVTEKLLLNFPASDTSICSTGTVVVTQLNNGNTSYFYSASVASGFTPTSTVPIEWTVFFTIPFRLPALTTAITKTNCSSAYSKLIGDSLPVGTTHVLLTSTCSYASMQLQVQNDNFMNCRTASMDQLSACYNERALQYALTEQQERIDLISILFAIKYGADIIATAARIVSNVVSYLIPIITVNGRTIGPNQALVFDMGSTQQMNFEVLEGTPRSILEYPPVTNASIAVIDV